MKQSSRMEWCTIRKLPFAPPCVLPEAEVCVDEALVLLSAVHQGQLNQALEDIKNHLVAQGLPRLWAPREIIPVEAIPALPTGKMDLKGCQILAYEALNIPH